MNRRYILTKLAIGPPSAAEQQKLEDRQEGIKYKKNLQEAVEDIKDLNNRTETAARGAKRSRVLYDAQEEQAKQQLDRLKRQGGIADEQTRARTRTAREQLEDLRRQGGIQDEQTRARTRTTREQLEALERKNRTTRAEIEALEIEEASEKAKKRQKLGPIGKAIYDNKLMSRGLAALGTAGAPMALEAIKDKLTPKPSLAQELLGKGSLGRKALGLGLGAATIGLGVSLADKGYKGIEGPIKKRSYYNKMIEMSPSLKKENPKDVKNIFNTLYKFNPKMASDPLVASSFLKRSLQFKDEGIQAMDIKTLTEAARNIAQSKPKSQSVLSEAFPTAATALSGLG